MRTAGSLLLFLCSCCYSYVSADLLISGNVTAVDENLATQEVVFNGTDVYVKDPRYLTISEAFLPLLRTSPQVISDDLILSLAWNTLVFMNTTSFTHTSVTLTCSPVSPALVNSNQLIILCVPGQIAIVDLSSFAVFYERLRPPQAQNFNGTLSLGFAPNYAVHFITGVGSELYVKDFYSGQSSLVPVPSCDYISDVKIVSGNHQAIFCADDVTNASVITSVHFRNLTVSHYVSIELTIAIHKDTFLIESWNHLVLLADRNNLHVINRINGTYTHSRVNGNITDIVIDNPSLAYYLTSTLVKFSPADKLRGFPILPQQFQSACGPPVCAFATPITGTDLLYSVNETSFKLKGRQGSINLRIRPLFFIHNLTLYEDKRVQPSPSATTEPTIAEESSISKGVWAVIPIGIFGIIAAIVIAVIVIAVVVIGLIVWKYKYEGNRGKLSTPIQEEESSSPPAEEHGGSTQETV